MAKKQSKQTPTQCTLNECRRRNWIAQVVEHWVPIPDGHRVRRDLFGFIDIVAVRDDGGVVFIQATSWENVSSRVRKIVDDRVHNERASRIVQHNAICVVGWKQREGKGSRWIGYWHYITPLELGVRDFSRPTESVLGLDDLDWK